MTSRPNVPVICPSASSIIRSAASLRRVPWGECPDLIGTTRRLRLLASPRASLRLLRSALPPLRPRSLPRSRTMPRGPGLLLPRRPRRPLVGGEDETSQVPGRPLRTCPALRPRRTAGPRPLRDRRWGLPRSRPRRLRHANSFGAPSRGLHALCVRFAAGVTPPACATLDSGWWPTLAGRDSHPLGRVEDFRRVFPFTSPSLLTKLRLAQREMVLANTRMRRARPSTDGR